MSDSFLLVSAALTDDDWEATAALDLIKAEMERLRATVGRDGSYLGVHLDHANRRVAELEAEIEELREALAAVGSERP